MRGPSSLHLIAIVGLGVLALAVGAWLTGDRGDASPGPSPVIAVDPSAVRLGPQVPLQVDWGALRPPETGWSPAPTGSPAGAERLTPPPTAGSSR